MNRQKLIRILRRSRIWQERSHKGTMVHRNKKKYNRKKEKEIWRRYLNG